MSRKAVEEFRKAVRDSQALQEEIRASTEAGAKPQDIVAIAAKHGFDFTTDEMSAVANEVSDELTDFELEMVAAGVGDTETMFTGRASMQAAISIPSQPKEHNPNAELC